MSNDLLYYSDTNSDSDDYYGSDEEIQIAKKMAIPCLKIGRLSTVKEKPIHSILNLHHHGSRKHSKDEKLNDVIEETDSDMKEEDTPNLKVHSSGHRKHRFSKVPKEQKYIDFDEPPPPIMTKSIELNKSKDENDVLGKMDDKRNLFTPCLERNISKTNKIRKIPNVSDFKKNLFARQSKLSP